MRKPSKQKSAKKERNEKKISPNKLTDVSGGRFTPGGRLPGEGIPGSR
ncbi:hypothetical protein [Legionella jamestowniensis]|nr:hypothetical protein [Legionella jamestowniensis]